MEDNCDGSSHCNGVQETLGASTPAEEVASSQSVKVAVHIRPLIASERLQGCKDCITVVSGKPQVQVGTHSFTFDHVYGSSGSSSSKIFEECVSPLIDGLFSGYNATVLAYGQTGSGKTYTMGSGDGELSEIGIIPQAMELIFKKIENMKHQAEFQLRVSFIEILKEEVHDLLDPNVSLAIKMESNGSCNGKPAVVGKPPIQIRENSNGVITLAGSTEIDVNCQKEMAACLAQGLASRATGSTNMNSHSSRSHAIFTITMEQMKKCSYGPSVDSGSLEDAGEEFLCAKLHLVDLAGSERAKRTGADGVRLKEGIHINKGLLALGNVISALGDEKKRKEGVHVPYRDSKLTRLLQDSLGGNSKTLMIACVSPADINAEETLNTLKYANRARNIQNKPIVNRDPMSNEMQRMRQQIEYLQSELLCARGGGAQPADVQALKQRIAWLESSNTELSRQLLECRNKCLMIAQHALEAESERSQLSTKLDMLRSGKSWKEIEVDEETQLAKNQSSKMHELESEVKNLLSVTSQAADTTVGSFTSFLGAESNGVLSPSKNYTVDSQPMVLGRVTSSPGRFGSESREAEEAEKEWEHNLLQETMDKELNELNKQLQQKELEMKLFGEPDTSSLKQHFGKKLLELEEEKNSVQKERDRLLAEVENLANKSDGQAHKIHETYVQKLKFLETQISDLKKKQENQVQLVKQKQRSEEEAKRLQEEIQYIKAQKVQLQNRIKQEAEQFRSWKTSREKELLQLRKEGRRNEYEMHKLQALNQRQKLVLQRKTEEAAMATKRLKELLEGRKASSRENSGLSHGNGSAAQASDKSLQKYIEHELEVAVHVHKVRLEYDKQTEVRSAIAKELAKLKQEDEVTHKGLLFPNGKNGSPVRSSIAVIPPPVRQARITMLEAMMNTASNTLVSMATQLSEAEEQERAFNGRVRLNQLRTLADAKNLIQYLFKTAILARCQSVDKEIQNRELKETNNELGNRVKQAEFYKKELEKQLHLKEQAIAIAVAKANSDSVSSAPKNVTKSTSGGLSSMVCPPRHPSQNINRSPNRHNDLTLEMLKAVSTRSLVGAKLTGKQTGKLWKWKRSHQQWLLQFKWKWQKPWRLSEVIKENDLALFKMKSRHSLSDTK
eukprot:TRINITY_DN3636_c0_g2_i1.p1 TRINITY_DN3636_c0_g2~~TRINITY_DN3636_c0_g2_i1.p1  ORF type:complete len:1127 (+),score=289.52 TRINITY_DN3636_c0_g2_i1:329-3709(+)